MAAPVTGSETAGLFTRKALSEAFGTHVMTITKWEQDGLPVSVRGTRGRPSLYRLADCVAWRIEREVQARGGSANGEPSSLSALQQRALLDEKRREELDLRIKIRRGELIEVEEAARDLANVAAATKARMRRIPDAIIDKLGLPPSARAAAKKRMLAAIDDALRELAVKGESFEDVG